jgi:three-Cys-motif partner protein
VATRDFHDKPFDPGTLTKLRIFELYTQEWLPVFLSRADSPFGEVHLFDFFCGPGTDSTGKHGSPLLTLNQLRRFSQQGLAGWSHVEITAHFFDVDSDKIQRLAEQIQKPSWQIPAIQLDLRPIEFQVALAEYRPVLENPNAAKLLIIDQSGVDEVSDDVFRRLIQFPRTDFIFFLSSSTLHRFRGLPVIKQKIGRPERSFDVHRAAFNYYRALLSKSEPYYLAPFSIKKRGNIYGLIFGSRHPRGIDKFLHVAWQNDEIAGEANFDIENENIEPGELLLPLEVMRPTKIKVFERNLENAFRTRSLLDEAAIIRHCIEFGMTRQHAEPVLAKLKKEGFLRCSFRVPDITRLDEPKSITYLG